ncbi:hypothetical protein [Aurantibacter crassamenti]|uniref:hypothetical protein n=1 Tax=Aurantibacter crassamenti TaxID=1837375 RepID=UPI001EEEF90A|nr:hypothetical protein [Aurantibacter crassamenti]
MKKVTYPLFVVVFLLLSTASIQAQELKEKKAIELSEEEEGPLMYKFEPNFISAVENRRAEIRKTHAIIDTMQITDRKRRRLLRDLYKNGGSERLSKVVLADTKFEDASE